MYVSRDVQHSQWRRSITNTRLLSVINSKGLMTIGKIGKADLPKNLNMAYTV